MMVGAALGRVPPRLAVILEAFDRRRIGIAFVELLDLSRRNGGCRLLVFALSHCDYRLGTWTMFPVECWHWHSGTTMAHNAEPETEPRSKNPMPIFPAR